MKDWKSIGGELTTLLRLQTYPIGVRLFKKGEETPPIFRKPQAKVNLCQLTALSRQQGLPVVGGAEDMVCIAGAALVGLIKMPERLASGELCLRYHVDKDTAKIKMDKVPALKDSYSAIGFFALGKVGIEPEIILIYGNSAQMMRLVHASLYHNGEPLHFTTSGEFACAYSIAYPIITNTPHITIPCFGERKYGQLADDLLIFSIPLKFIDNVIEGLTETHKKGIRLPIAQQFDFYPSISEPWHIREEDL